MNWLFVRLPGKEGEHSIDALAAESSQPAPNEGDPPAVWAEAACNASDKGLASDWAGRVEGDALLAEIATRSRFAEIRLVAARRIADVAVLRRVAEASKDKDKHVYRHCADRIR